MNHILLYIVHLSKFRGTAWDIFDVASLYIHTLISSAVVRPAWWSSSSGLYLLWYIRQPYCRHQQNSTDQIQYIAIMNYVYRHRRQGQPHPTDTLRRLDRMEDEDSGVLMTYQRWPSSLRITLMPTVLRMMPGCMYSMMSYDTQTGLYGWVDLGLESFETQYSIILWSGSMRRIQHSSHRFSFV